MKKSFIAICAMACALLMALCAHALAEGTLELDSEHAYSNMTRPYVQGYSPLVKGNYAYVVLPLLAGERDEAITATLMPDAPEVAPYELTGLVQQFKPRSYTFDGERVRAYLISFRLKLYSDCMDGDYPLTISVLDGERERRYRLTLSISQRAANPEVPRVDIADCAAELNVGETGELLLELVNRSKTRAVRDVTLALSDPDGHVLPLAVDTLDVPDLAPGDSASLTLPVRVQPDAPAQSHAVQFELNYGYGDDKTAQQALRYTLNLNQRIRLNYTEPVLPEYVTQGDVTTLSITLMNMGRGKLVNALLTPDLPGLSSGGSVLVGDIEPGQSASGAINFRVSADAQGLAQGTLEIYCEDEYGNAHAQQVAISTTVRAAAAPTAIPTSPREETTPLDLIPSWVPWALAGCLALALVAVTVRFRRRIRLAEEQQL